jgi:tetratricopeptide (TPR) repeat protein
MYAELLKKYPDEPLLIWHNAEWNVHCGRFKEALAGFTKVVNPDEKPEQPYEGYMRLASCYIGLGDIARAKQWFAWGCEEYEKALTKLFDERLEGASDPAVRLKFVKELLINDQSSVAPCHAAAAKELSDILNMEALPPQLVLECTFLMATSLFESHQFLPAAQAFGKAVALAKAAPAGQRGQYLGLALFNQGHALAKAKEWDKAIEVFLALIGSNVDDRDPGGHIMEACRSYRHRAALEIARCYEAKGDSAKAYDWTKRARDRYRLVSICGTCRDQSEEELDRRLDELAGRAGVGLLARHAVSSGFIWRRWYFWTPVLAVLVAGLWLLRRKRRKGRKLQAGPPT